MQMVITGAVQDLQIVRHAPIVRVVPIVHQVVLVGYVAVALLRKKLTRSEIIQKRNPREAIVI